MEMSRTALEGLGARRGGWRRKRWSSWWRSEAMKETRRDLASENLPWPKREGRRERREWGEEVREGEWDWRNLKKERRVEGREDRVLEESRERKRGWVRFGRCGIRVSSGVFGVVRILVMVSRT